MQCKTCAAHERKLVVADDLFFAAIEVAGGNYKNVGASMPQLSRTQQIRAIAKLRAVCQQYDRVTKDHNKE